MKQICKGKLRIISRHPVLDQVAIDISENISDPETMALPVNVYVGAHKFRKKHILKNGYNLRIQTEHFFDQSGRTMWRKQSKLRILRHVLLYDRILDLFEHNRAAYQWLPSRLRSKVDFGPYIFPNAKIDYSGHSIDKVVFYGSVNQRRSQKLASIPDGLVHCVDSGTFGDPLNQTIKNHLAVLNVHFSEGVYTEYPRILSAYLRGKTVI